MTPHGRKKKKTHQFVTSHLFFFFYPVTLFFSCLEKQTRAHRYCQSTACLCADPELLFFFFFQNSLEYANEGASHSIVEWVMWPEQRGLRARRVGGGGVGSSATDEEGGGGDLHLPPSAVRASRSLHNGNSPMDFFFPLFSWTKTR